MKIAWNKKSSNFELELIVENSKNIDEYCSKIILEDISSAGGGAMESDEQCLGPENSEDSGRCVLIQRQTASEPIVSLKY